MDNANAMLINQLLKEVSELKQELYMNKSKVSEMFLLFDSLVSYMEDQGSFKQEEFFNHVEKILKEMDETESTNVMMDFPTQNQSRMNSELDSILTSSMFNPTVGEA